MATLQTLHHHAGRNSDARMGGSSGDKRRAGATSQGRNLDPVGGGRSSGGNSSGGWNLLGPRNQGRKHRDKKSRKEGVRTEEEALLEMEEQGM